MTNLNTLREYNLQKAVQAAKGKFVTVDLDNKYHQWHQKGVSDEERQFAVWRCCSLELVKWEKGTNNWTCEACQKVSQRGDATSGTYKCWYDGWGDHGERTHVCLDCIPVVLKTQRNDDAR